MWRLYINQTFKHMNKTLDEAFKQGIKRFYPYNNTRLIVTVYKSFVTYYIEGIEDSHELEIIQVNQEGLPSFLFNGSLVPICLSLPYESK